MRFQRYFARFNPFFRLYELTSDYKLTASSMRKHGKQEEAVLFQTLRKYINREIPQFFKWQSTSFKRHYRAMTSGQLHHFLTGVSHVYILTVLEHLDSAIEGEGEEDPWVLKERLEAAYLDTLHTAAPHKEMYQYLEGVMASEGAEAMYTLWYREIYLVYVLEETKYVSKAFAVQEEQVFSRWLRRGAESFAKEAVRCYGKKR